MKKIILSAVVLALLSACNNSNEVDTSIIHNPNSAQGYNESESMPVIKFEKQLHDFGNLSSGETISYSFKFKNTGNADLIIQACESTCGCTVPDYPKDKIAPGKEGYVTVAFNSSGKHGMDLQEVTVVSNTQPSRTKLRIQATIR